MSKFVELLDDTPSYPSHLNTARAPSTAAGPSSDSAQTSPTTSAPSVTLEDIIAETRLRSPSTSSAGSIEAKS
ncbi:Midasin [Sphaceloma murrayae]|uniref:Midasin n=1 Tax=Sphaceloma murrayae TaxID=2082308 RepID=A0A2K1QIL2_9PEZI|nr:Midasin [Sphaceloma murrayae]